jgi:phosphotransferase system  glucose/maltose/N-acetylglucosamine-specific IIC component
MLESSTTTQSESIAHAAAADTAARGRATFFTGIFTGALLIVVMLAALVAANRAPAFEAFALERNAISYTLFVLLMLAPVCRFRKNSVQMFLSGMLGWVLFVAAYDIAGMVFHDLFQVLRPPFELLIEGMIVYGVLAVASWVARMISHARREPIQPRRRRTDHIVSHHH